MNESHLNPRVESETAANPSSIGEDLPPLPSVERPIRRWSISSKPGLIVLFCLAGWGSLTLVFQLLAALGDWAIAFLIATTCVALVATHRFWRPYFDRVATPSSAKDNCRSLFDWRFIVAMCIIGIFVQGQRNQDRKIHLMSQSGGAQIWLQRRQATLTYWQSTVSSLHVIRFHTPSGQEPAEKYFERMFQQMRQLTSGARAMSTVNVDPDLVTMVGRHLAFEEQILQLKQEVDELMKNEKMQTLTDTVEQRMAITRLLLGTLEANPEVLKNLPPGPERDLFEKALDTEHKRLEQFREIEIMQAILQERYKGTAFPLPAIQP